MRKCNFIGIDTETTNGLIDENGKIDLTQSLCYDVGWVIFNKRGKIKERKSFVVAEIFLDKSLMENAYFKEKIPQYWNDIKAGRRVLKRFINIFFEYRKDRKKYNSKVTFAHNAQFDFTALNNTLRYLTGSKMRYFFPYSVEIWDTLKMSQEVFGQNEEYALFCKKNNYLTKHKSPKNRYTAEILYRFLSGKDDFIESHTGLEDTLIEKEIFMYCYKRKPKNKALFDRALF